MENNDGVYLLQLRRDLYNLLRHIFRGSLNADLLASLKSWLGEKDYFEDDSLVGKGLKLVKEVLTSAGDLPVLAERLAGEYTRLFLGPGRAPVGLYETLYTSENRLLMQETTLAVRKCYLQAGLVSERLNSVPDDYLAAEMEYMFFLCVQTLENLELNQYAMAERYLELQREFLDRHLLTWLPGMARDLENNTSEPFFKGIALITRGLMEVEREVVFTA